MLLKKNLAYPYEFYKTLEDYEKPIEELIKSGKEAYFSKTKIRIPDQEEIGRKKEIKKLFIIKNGREITEPYNKADAILLADIFEKFIKVSISEFSTRPLYDISPPGTTWSNGLRYTKSELELIKYVDFFQVFENGILGAISGVFGDRYIESNKKKFYTLI